MSDNLWCFAWTSEVAEVGAKPNRDGPYFCTSTLSETRVGAWDSILASWFTYNPTHRLYYGSVNRVCGRHGAMAYLKRRGGRVIRVKVVPT